MRLQATIRPTALIPLVGKWQAVAVDPNNLKRKNRNLKSAVSLSDRFDIRSGLLEITYDTGAKVVLQGPVTYEVD